MAMPGSSLRNESHVGQSYSSASTSTAGVRGSRDARMTDDQSKAILVSAPHLDLLRIPLSRAGKEKPRAGKEHGANPTPVRARGFLRHAPGRGVSGDPSRRWVNVGAFEDVPGAMPKAKSQTWGCLVRCLAAIARELELIDIHKVLAGLGLCQAHKIAAPIADRRPLWFDAQTECGLASKRPRAGTGTGPGYILDMGDTGVRAVQVV